GPRMEEAEGDARPPADLADAHGDPQHPRGGMEPGLGGRIRRTRPDRTPDVHRVQRLQLRRGEPLAARSEQRAQPRVDPTFRGGPGGPYRIPGRGGARGQPGGPPDDGWPAPPYFALNEFRRRLLLPTPDTTTRTVVDLIQVLNDAYNTPWLYMLLAFVYAVLVALILPIPIEIALLLPLIHGRWGYLTGIALAIAAGKPGGAWLIFLLGLNLEGSVRKWSDRWRVARWFVAKPE